MDGFEENRLLLEDIQQRFGEDRDDPTSLLVHSILSTLLATLFCGTPEPIIEMHKLCLLVNIYVQDALEQQRKL